MTDRPKGFLTDPEPVEKNMRKKKTWYICLSVQFMPLSEEQEIKDLDGGREPSEEVG